MPLFWLYKNTMTVAKPLAHHILMRRMRIGKEDPERIAERCGIDNRPRPAGTLLWVHVASVGEAQSMLRLIEMFLAQHPDASALVTSITATSAKLLAQRLPPRAFHAFFPVDRPSWVRRFLDHWKPDIIFWAESELWPCMINEIGRRHVPMALINARMSPRSFRHWKMAGGFIGEILNPFSVILTQSSQDKHYFEELGGRCVVVAGNIKFAASPLPCDAEKLAELKAAVTARPVWVYASTHDGEEELAIGVHRDLRTRFPDLLTIIIPRHPERRDSLIPLFEASGLSTAVRSMAEIPDAATDIYLVDTLGEMGLFYRLAPLSVVGRSFSRDGGGGHNPLEPALLSCAVLHGPHVQNLQDIYAPMDQEGAACCVSDSANLADVIGTYLSAPEELNKLRQKGYDFAKARSGVLHTVAEELEPLFILAGLPALTPTS